MYTRKCIGCDERLDELKLIGGYCEKCHKHVGYSAASPSKDLELLDIARQDAMTLKGYAVDNFKELLVPCVCCGDMTRSRYSCCPACRKNLMGK